MMLLPVTLATTALATLVNIWLASRVVFARRDAKVSIGDGGCEPVIRRMRAHSNFTENAPIFIMLVAGIELAGGERAILLPIAAAFLVARVAHGIGMEGGSLTRYRSVGMSTSTLATLVAAVWAIVLAAGAL
jgi:uncharacterized membrane protein YecN with MAPEG domain